MPSRAWMPFYIGDYRRDTAHLTTEEHGAYFLLIIHYWETGPLVADDRQLARIAGLSLKRWMAVRATLKSFFLNPATQNLSQHLLDGRWHHKRIDEELAKAENISTKRRLAAMRSQPITRGRNNVGRWTVANMTPANAQQKHTQSQSHIERGSPMGELGRPGPRNGHRAVVPTNDELVEHYGKHRKFEKPASGVLEPPAGDDEHPQKAGDREG